MADEKVKKAEVKRPGSKGFVYPYTDGCIIKEPKDDLDPGFEIPGYKMRWLAKEVQQRRATRIWRVIHVHELHPEIQEHLRAYNPYAISEGDTIRRGRGTVLAAASVAEVKKHRAKLDEKNRQLVNSADASPGKGIESETVLEGKSRFG